MPTVIAESLIYYRIMDDLEQALDIKLQQIAKELENPYLRYKLDYNLMGGLSGVALFLFYYSDYKKSKSYRKQAEDYLEQIFEHFNQSNDIIVNYAEGITGFLSVILHLLSNGYLDKDHVEIDEIIVNNIYNVCREGINNYEDDFFYGTGGLLLFLIDKYRFQKEKKTRKYISTIIKDLVARKVHSTNIFSSYRPDILHFEISMPHGYSSWMILLTQIFQQDIEKELCVFLMHNLYKYYESFLFAEKKGDSYFPEIINDKTDITKPIHSRLGWCYGDIPCLLSLLSYAHSIQNSKLIDLILKRFDTVGKRKELEQNGIYDSCICHGSAGLGYIFNFLYHKYSHTSYKETATYWYRRTLEIGHFEDGCAGYKKRDWLNNQFVYTNEYGFLEGIAGIGLSLMAFQTEKYSHWENLY